MFNNKCRLTCNQQGWMDELLLLVLLLLSHPPLVLDSVQSAPHSSVMNRWGEREGGRVESSLAPSSSDKEELSVMVGCWMCAPAPNISMRNISCVSGISHSLLYCVRRGVWYITWILNGCDRPLNNFNNIVTVHLSRRIIHHLLHFMQRWWSSSSPEVNTLQKEDNF